MLIKPIITERSVKEAALHRYTFAVEPKMTKPEIKRLVEKLFKVNVIKTQTSIVPGKKYRSGKRWIYRQKSDWKRATVTVKPDQKIELIETGEPAK